MAFSVGVLEASVTANTSRFSQGLNRAFREGSQFSRQMQAQFRRVGQSMTRIGTQLTAGLTLPLVGAGTLAVSTAADYEQLNVQLRNLTGSAEEGARVFQDIQQFSARTPFQMQDLIRATNTMIGMGVATDEALQNLRLLGNVSSATGADMNELSRIFAESAAEGRLMTRDIRQFINQGVPAVNLLADSMGVARGEIFDLASQGRISFDDLQKAIEDVAGEGGQWATATEDQSRTISGLFSTLRDNVSIALAEIGETIAGSLNLRELIPQVTEQIGNIVERFRSLSPEVQRMIPLFAGLVSAIGPTIAILGGLSIAISAISAPVAGIVAAIGVAAAAIISNWSDVERYFTTGGGARVFDNLSVIVQNVVSVVTSLWDVFGDRLIEATTIAWRVISETIGFFLNNVRTVTSVFANAMRGDWRQLWEDLRVDTENINNQMASVVADVWSSLLTQLRQDVIRTFEVIFRIMSLTPVESVRVAGEMGEAWISALSEMENAAWDAGVTIRENIETNATAAVESVMNAVSNIPDTTANVTPSVDLSGIERSARQIQGETLLGDPEVLQASNVQIQQAGENLQGVANESMNVSREFDQFGFTVAQVFDRAIFQGQRLHSVLRSLLRQLASQALLAFITGGTSGVSKFFGGFFGGSVGDALITDSGKIVRFDPNDNILAMKDFGNLAPSGGGEVNLNIKLSGQFEQRGDTLEAIVREEVRRQVRLQ